MVGGDLSLLQKIQLVKRLGFDGIELDRPNNLDKQEVLDARDRNWPLLVAQNFPRFSN